MTVNKFYPSRKPFKFIKVTLLSFSNARRVITTKLRRVSLTSSSVIEVNRAHAKGEDRRMCRRGYRGKRERCQRIQAIEAKLWRINRTEDRKKKN